MKTIASVFCSVLTLFCATISFGQNGAFSIDGVITGLADKTSIAITDPENPTDTLAKTVSNKEQFKLNGKLQIIKLYHLSFIGSDKKALLFLDKKKMQLSGSINAVQQLKLSGSPAHDGFMVFQQEFDPFFREYAKLSETANRTGINDSLMQRYQALVKSLGDKAAQFSTERKDQVVAPFMWATILQVIENPDLVEKHFNEFTPDVKSSYYGKFLFGRIEDAKIGRIGSPALEFSQADTTGKPVALSSFRGKYVLVDFWASWCGPCRQENPNVVRAHDRFKGKNFTVLGISLDNNKAKWLKAIEDDQLNWTQLSDLKHWQNEVAVRYKVQSIPQNLLIDPSGVIIGKNLRGEELQTKLCELLGCD